MTDGPDFSDYDKRMEDLEYRARMDRTDPFTPEEEAQLYALLDEAIAPYDEAAESQGLPDQPAD